MMLLLAGCAANQAETYRLQTEAAARQGVVAAGVDLGPVPAVCTRERDHATLRIGEELSSLLKRERGITWLQNQDKQDCGVLLAKQRAEFGQR